MKTLNVGSPTKMLTEKEAKNLISSTDVYKTLADLVRRSPSTMRKNAEFNLQPEGFILKKGVAVHMFSKKTLAIAIAYLKTNPPKGSGRPKGSKNRGKK